jgi:hypothetical protein
MLYQALAAQEQLYRQEVARSSRVVSEYHARLLQVDQELDEILHLQRQPQRQEYGEILPGLFDDCPVTSRSSEKWEVYEESQHSSYVPPEGLGATQLEVFRRLADLHKKVHKFRHCGLSQDVPKSAASLSQDFQDPSLPSDLKSLTGGLSAFFATLAKHSGRADDQHEGMGGQLELAGGRDVRLEDMLGEADGVKDFEGESSIELAPLQDQSVASCELVAALGSREEDSVGAGFTEGRRYADHFSGLSVSSLSVCSDHTNVPEVSQAASSERVTVRRGVPQLHLNLLEKSRPSGHKKSLFDLSSGRVPLINASREVEVRPEISYFQDSAITPMSENSSKSNAEDRSKGKPAQGTVKQTRGRDDLSQEKELPPLNLSTEPSSHKTSKPRITPISMQSKAFPAKPLSSPHRGLKSFRGRLMLRAKQLYPVSIPTSPSYRPDVSSQLNPDGSTQTRSNSPLNHFRMRRFCESKQPPRLCILSRQ